MKIYWYPTPYLHVCRSIVTRFANNLFFLWCWTECRIIRLTGINPNNSRILRIFPEFYKLFANFSWIFPIIWLSCRTEISGPDNSESFLNYTWIILESQIFDLAEPNLNNSFVTMCRSTNVYYHMHKLISEWGATEDP